MTTNKQSGFTLIEVLLAVAITATVMLTVGTTFHIMLNARDIVDDLAESSEAGPRILNLIERDLRGLWTYNIKNNKVFKGTVADVNGRDADRMNFLTTTDSVGTVTDLQSVPHKTTLCEIGYWFKPNPRFRDVFELWRREDPMVDEELSTQGSFQLVHDRVKNFKIRYFASLGFEAEELLEWDSSVEDKLPKRIKIEFTIERPRSSSNVVSDLEVEDFEGAEKTYVRHFVFDDRLNDILAANSARIPVLPPPPTADGGNGDPAAAGGPAGPAGPGGPGGPAGPGGQTNVSKGRATTKVSTGGPLDIPIGAKPGMGSTQGRTGGGARGTSPTGGQPPTQLPPGFDFRQIFGGLGGGSGSGGLFGG
jgi:prepilin-type N-terminal cleavage/methylation domain-containing protein